MERFETLTAAYFDERLSASESAGLARMLESDPGKATPFVEEYEIDRLLRFRAVPVDETRIDAILDQIQRESDPFVRSVFQAVKQDSFARRKQRTFWQNWVEQLFQRPGWAVFATTCLLVIGCAWIFYFRITVGEPRLELAASASIEIVRGAISTQARQGFDLRAGDLLKVTGTNDATLSFAPEKTRIQMRPGTELKLVNYSGAKRFVLNTGKIDASVGKQRMFKPMFILTPQAQVRVIGTRFTLTASANATRLEVTEGKVRLIRLTDGAKVQVAAGNYAVAASDYELAAQPLTGSILREYWTNVPGSEIPVVLLFDPRYPDHPSTRMYLPSFEAPSNAGQNFGARFRGYIHPPVTGEYTFWLAAWEGAELYLSKDDQPEHKVQIAVAYHKESRDWDDEDVQKSSALALVGGRRYYIEALQRQRTGGDCLAVAWQGPGRGREVIPGEFLSPFKLKAKENQH